jgi:hypothetical protein
LKYLSASPAKIFVELELHPRRQVGVSLAISTYLSRDISAP